MKIRSITTGICLCSRIMPERIGRFTAFANNAKDMFERSGYDVQTVRLTTQPWKSYLFTISKKRLLETIAGIERLCTEDNVNFVNLGTVDEPELIRCIPSIIQATSHVSLSATITSRTTGVLDGSIRAAAYAIQRISRITDRGYGNFRFAAIANCPPHIPFYPASYHAGVPCFSLALECSDLVVEACARARNLSHASERLFRTITKTCKKIERVARRIEKKHKVRFCGIDTSPAPSLNKQESLVIAFEKLLGKRFGAPGTLSIARMITHVLKSIPIKKCGYCGLMLPVLEDYGLARAYSEKRIMLDRLLMLSSVCGTGLDCVPLSGSISINTLQTILRDVATLAVTLNKPLSARLFPVPGKKAGQRTDFRSPYLVDCRLIDV